MPTDLEPDNKNTASSTSPDSQWAQLTSFFKRKFLLLFALLLIVTLVSSVSYFPDANKVAKSEKRYRDRIEKLNQQAETK